MPNEGGFILPGSNSESLADAFKVGNGDYSRILYSAKTGTKCKGTFSRVQTCKVSKYLPLIFSFQNIMKDVLHQYLEVNQGKGK